MADKLPPELKPGFPASQIGVLEFFQERADSGMAPPTLREVATRFGWSSSAAARYHVDRLIQAGVLARSPGKARAAHLADTVSIKLPFVTDPFAPNRSLGAFMGIAVPKQLLPPAAGAFIVQANLPAPKLFIDEGDLVILRADRPPTPGERVAVVRPGGVVQVLRHRRGPLAKGLLHLGVVVSVMRRYMQPEDDE